MCTIISGNSYIGKILNKELDGKNETSSADLYHIDKNNDHKSDLDPNKDGNISAEELKNYLKQEGLLQKGGTAKQQNVIDKQIALEAQTLTKLIQNGCTFVRHETEPKSVDFDLNQNQEEKAPELSRVKTAGDTENEPVFKLGMFGEAIKQLQILLNKLDVGTKFTPNNKFDQRTEDAVRMFQKNNKLPETGIVDKTTLKAMEEATKLDSNEVYIQGKVNPVTGVTVTDTDRVKAMVATQLNDQGVDLDKAFSIGEKLVSSQQRQDKKMASEHLCYTAVKNAFQGALDLPYERFPIKKGNNGSWARTAGTNLLSKHPDVFKEIKGLQREDLKFLPAGAVVVYKPTAANKPGHIGVQNGQGKDISDKERIQANVHVSANFEVFFPIDTKSAKK